MEGASGPENVLLANGYNWFSKSQPYMSEPTTDDVYVVLDSCTVYLFHRLGDIYVAETGSDQISLAFDSSACEFTFTDCQGVQIKFTNKGVFKQRIEPSGQQIDTTFNALGWIAEISQSVVQEDKTIVNSTLMEYYESGPWYGLVSKTTSKRTRNPSLGLRQMVYTYYGADEEHGSLGDLKTATEQILQGTTWVDHETSYYRYYKDGETNGFEHGLKYALGPQAYARLAEDPQVGDPLLASDTKVAEYADNYYEYDGAQRATKSVVQAGLLTYTFSYTSSAHSDDPNHWKLKVTTTRPDGSQQIRYSNYLQQTMLTDFKSGSDHWIEYYQFNAQAQEILHASPAAVISYDDTQADLDLVLRSTAGLITTTEFYTSTTATPTVAGGVDQYVKATWLQKGTSGTPVQQSETTYYERTAGGVTIYPVAEATVFRHDDGSGGITTSYSYTWFTDTLQIEQRTTTLPVVPSGQNGTGTTDTITEIYDAYGNLVWQRDPLGFISYRAYDWALGVLTQQIQDVDGAKLTLPPGWTTPVGGGLHLITDYEHDPLGRTTQTLGPAHDVNGQTVRTASWMAYRDLEDETYSGQGYATGVDAYQYTLVNPVSIRQSAHDGLSNQSITAVRRCDSEADCGCALAEAGVVESAGRLSASDCFPQSSWVRWSTSIANPQGQTTTSRAYHTIPAAGSGAVGINYDETTYGYDQMNRRNRMVAPTGTISRTVYDVRGQAVSSWLGTNDKQATDSDPTGGGASGNNMVRISAMQYDGGSAGGDGNLTQQTADVDGSTTRVTNYEYDFRNRRIVTDGEIDFYQTTAYDNLSQVIQVERRDTNSGGNLIARSESAYDNRGRVYQTLQYAVDPSTGTVGNSLVSNTYYDANGQTLESYPAGSEAFSKMTYDGVGRQIAQYVGYAESSAGSSSSSGGAAGDVIFEQRETLYDAASNVIFSTSRQRFHDATGTGPLQGPSGSQPKSRDSYGAMWYDGVGRSVASANYGTNDNAGPPERPEVPPESTELILVSQTGYNERGEAFETIDPSGMVGRSYADDAGRTVRTIQNYVAGEGCFCPGSEQNVTTEMRYGPGSQLWQLIAKNPATGDQVTRYDYGVTLSNSDLASNDLLRAEIYCWKWCHCNDFVEVCPLARLNLRCTPAQKR